MKKLHAFIVLALILANLTLKSQAELWGVAPAGANGFGAIFGMPTGSTGIATQYNLTGSHGTNPQQTRLVQASNGKFYGTTFSGGVNNLGVIFEYNESTNAYVKLWDFVATSGSSPRGPLMQASNGKLYGMTTAGGANNVGVIYEYDITTSTYTKKVDLSATNGSQPFGTLMELSTPNGKLYGMTRIGGTSNVGVIFEYDLSTGAYTKKIDLTATLGSNPFGQMVQSGTMLYAVCAGGGTASVGSIIEYDYTNNVCTKKIDMTTANGSACQGSLMRASDGNLYGVTTAGGANSAGAIFQYSISSNTYAKLYDLSTALGSNAPGTMVQSSANGKLYGFTRIGGANSQGVIFEFDYTTNTYSKRFDLQANTLIGGSTFSSPIFGSNGKLYAPLTAGGLASGGVIMEYDLSTSTYTKKIDLNHAASGGAAYGGLVYAANGKLYGTTISGGSNNVGVIFEYDKSTNSYTKKFDMLASSGSVPYGAMVEASNGNLYGLSNAGGANSLGVIYEYNYTTNTYTKKVDLSSTLGSTPFGSMIQASNGKLYGLTRVGGTSALGVLFEYDYTTNTYTKRVDLTAAIGSNPSGSLVEAPNGKLYGLTQNGGANSQGVIFEYDISTNTYTKKYDFAAGTTTGNQPLGSLVLANDGFLYGLTRLGGANGLGTLFQYDYVTNTFTKKLDLNSTSGSTPGTSLIKSANGKLYAPFTLGGTNNTGSIAEYDVTAGTLTKLIDLNATTSYSPSYSRFIEICPKPATPPSITSATTAICEADGSSKTFSIATLASATSYTWSLPAGASIVSGSLTNNIAVNFAGLTPGTYSFSVGGVNLCGTGSLAIGNVTIHPTPTLTANSGTICSGNSFTIIPSGASTYTYSSGSAIVSPLTSTFYTVTGTSSLGCVGSATSIITVNTTPTIGVNSGSICTGNSFTMIPSGASTYTFSSGSSIVSPLINTSYTVTGTSVAGCIGTNSAVSNVTVNITPTVSVNSGTLCSNNAFTMVPSGANTYTYSSGSSIVSPIINTSYSVTGTSAQGCVSSNTAVSNVTVYTTPTLAVNSGSICSGNTFTILTAGASTYTYSSGTPFVSPTTSTSYSVTGTSAQGCISSNTAISNVTVHTTPTITVNSGTICSGKSFTMIPGGANTYTYSSGSAIVSPLTNTSYSVTGTSAQGCVANNTAVSSVTIIANPTISVNSGSICTGNSFTMVPGGALTYTYSSGTAIVSPLTNTSYSVTGTSSLGCVSNNTAVSNVTVNITPTITVNSGSICTGNSFTMIPGGASTYTYSSGTAIVSPLINTSYSVNGTSAQGCVSNNTAVSNVTVNITPTVSVNSGSICTGKSFTMVPGGANTYTYSSGTAIVSPLINTSYSVTGTSAQGCVATNTAVSNVTVNITPTVSVNSGIICTGNSFTMLPSGASSYTYSSGSSIVSPLINTSYSVTGTSAQGCISTNTAVSNVTVNITPTITVNSGSICTGNSFTMIPGGASSYTYSSGTAIVSPLINSSYSVTGTSAQGCVSNNTAVSNVTVNITPTLSVNSGSICTGNSFTMLPSGANTYTYSSGTAIVSPLTNTSYSVTGTSAQGCVANNTAVSNVTVYITPTISVNSGSICTGNSFTILTSGASTYTYSSGGPIVSPLVNTSYSVTGTSAQGCVATNTAISNVTVNITPTVSVNSGSICTGNSFTMVGSGANTYTYSSGSAVVSPIINTSYNVTGTSAQGCVATNTAVSNVTVYITPTISINSGSICTGNSFTMVAGGANTYTYSSGSPVVSPLINTSYSVTGTSIQGCVSNNTAVSNVTVNITPTVSVNSGSICTGNSFTMIPNGANTYTYSSGSAIVSPLINTSYSVTGTSAQGCISTNTAISNVTVNITPTVSVNSGSICTGNSFTMVPSGANTYTYSSGSPIVSPIINTTYSVTGTSIEGCISNNTAVSDVTVYITPTVSVNSGSICTGNSFTMVPSGANTYTYSSGSAIVSPLVNISYSITATSAQGCVANNTAVSNVTVYVTPTVSINSGTICTGNSFTLVGNGASTYTYSSGSPIVSPLTNTSYSVTGTSIDGCVSNNTAVSDVTVYVTPTISVNSGSICTGNSFTMNPSGANTYTYSSGSPIVSPLVNTSFSVTGTSIDGCVSNNTAVSDVTVNITPTISVNSGSICTGNSFTILTSGASTYTYSSGTPIVSPLVTTSYSVTGTSAQGCIATNTAVSDVTVNITPTISVNSGSICSNNSFTMSPNGASTYTYSGGSAIVSPMVNTSYTVTGTSAQGCIASNTVVSDVTVHITPTVAINSGSICFGNSITLTPSVNPSGTVTYTITGGNYTVSPATTTLYSLQATSALGCISANTAVANVTVVALPVVSAASGTICEGLVFTPTVNGANTYTYSAPTPLTPSVNTIYSVIGRNTLTGCISNPPTNFTVVVNPRPSIVINGSTSICLGSATTLTASGASSYTWSTGNGSTITLSPSVTTNYSVYGTSAAGCSSLSVVNISVLPSPTITVTGGGICTGGSFTLTPNGALNYTYLPNGPIVNPTATTIYTINGEDANGCTMLTPITTTITVGNTLTMSITGNTFVCIGSTVNLTANGATTYSWNTGSVQNNISITPSVNTTYTAYGSSGTCSSVAVVEVTVNPLPNIVTATSSSLICKGQSATITASGATNYTWFPQVQTTSVIIVNPSQSIVYTVTATDDNGCSNITTIAQNVEDCVGIQQNVISNLAINIFPNPNSGLFFIDSPQMLNAYVYNNLGELILEQKINIGTNQINLEGKANGLYFVRITDGKTDKMVRIIKQ